MTSIWFQILSANGVFVFAISGALAAVRKDMDVFGIIFLAFLPAFGGGTLRDIVLDRPVFWICYSNQIWIVLAAGCLVFFASGFLSSLRKILIWADAIGLSVFAVTGTHIGFVTTHNPLVAVITGVLTAIAGGLIRDVVCNEIPLVLRNEIYATPAIAGAVSYLLLFWALGDISFAVYFGALVALILRAVGIIFRLSLPKAPRFNSGR